MTFHDWSASFRLFSKDRFDARAVFAGIRQRVIETLPADAPLCMALDDTIVRKTGRKIPGAAWRRDPLGPKFQTNLVHAQRFIQFSAALPASAPLLTPRLLPVELAHAPTPAKPPRSASAAQLCDYRQQCRTSNLSAVAVAQLKPIAEELKGDGTQPARRIHLLVDGSYTNKTVLRDLPANVTLIGRIRKDAALHWPPEQPHRCARGRTLRYGLIAPTPEQLRTDESVPWQIVTVVATGKTHQCRVKTIGPVLWRTAGAQPGMRVVVIAPLAYRKTPTPGRPTGKTLYRDPAFLICTDPDLSLEQIVQQYFWRWDIEVNFREQKTLLGMGQAQVRNRESCQNVPSLIACAYAVLLLANYRCSLNSPSQALPLPKWRKSSRAQRISTQRLVHQLRSEVWGRSLGIDQTHFSDFVSDLTRRTKSEKFIPQPATALLYANA